MIVVQIIHWYVIFNQYAAWYIDKLFNAMSNLQKSHILEPELKSFSLFLSLIMFLFKDSFKVW